MYSFFIHSPIDFHCLSTWPSHGAEIAEALRGTLGPETSIDVEDAPIISYGAYLSDPRALSLAVGPQKVRVDLWTSIVCYASIRVTVGEGIDPEAVRHALADRTLLNEHAGQFTPRDARLLGYSGTLPPPSQRAELLGQLADPVYIGSRHGGLFDEDGNVWDGVELVRLVDEVAVFRLLDQESERDFWSGALSSNSDGLILLDGEDPLLPTLLARYSDLDDMRLILSSPEPRRLRVTIGRCHMDDAYLCVFDGDFDLIETQLLFFV